MNEKNQKITLSEQEINTLLTLLEQNWYHARHVENERLSFINVYGIVVAGIMGLINIVGFKNSNITTIIILFFLMIFSFLGIVTVYKLSSEFHNHMDKITHIVTTLGVKEYMGLPLDREIKRKWKYLRFTFVFYVLFLAVISGCIIIILNIIVWLYYII